MEIKFYKVSVGARKDYMQLCKTSTAKTQKYAEDNSLAFVPELNRKIRRCANLGKHIEDKNGYTVKQFADLLFVIRDYTITDVYRDESIKPYFVGETMKNRYNRIESEINESNKPMLEEVQNPAKSAIESFLLKCINKFKGGK